MQRLDECTKRHHKIRGGGCSMVFLRSGLFFEGHFFVSPLCVFDDT